VLGGVIDVFDMHFVQTVVLIHSIQVVGQRLQIMLELLKSKAYPDTHPVQTVSEMQLLQLAEHFSQLFEDRLKVYPKPQIETHDPLIRL
jgi:hypothetical protein